MKGRDNKERSCQRDNQNANRGRPNRKCRKEGYDHLWKDFPDNPRNRNDDSNCGQPREINANTR